KLVFSHIYAPVDIYHILIHILNIQHQKLEHALINKAADIIDSSTQDHGNNGQNQHAKHTAIALHLAYLILPQILLSHTVVHQHDDYQKNQPCRRAQAGSQRASRRAVDSSTRTIRDSLCLIQGRAVRVQHTSSHNTDYRIDKLLNYLGNSRGHHSSHALEIPPEHAHNG